MIKNKNFRYFIIYISVTIFSLLTCAIYYIFSHGETDLHITLLFLPSTIVSLLFLILFFVKLNFNERTYYLFNSGFVFLWFYTLLMGVYNIAYVENKWVFVFLICSGIGFIACLINEIISRIKKEA